MIVPLRQAGEAKLVKGIDVFGIASITQLVAFLRDQPMPLVDPIEVAGDPVGRHTKLRLDLADVAGRIRRRCPGRAGTAGSGRSSTPDKPAAGSSSTGPSSRSREITPRPSPSSDLGRNDPCRRRGPAIRRPPIVFFAFQGHFVSGLWWSATDTGRRHDGPGRVGRGGQSGRSASPAAGPTPMEPKWRFPQPCGRRLDEAERHLADLHCIARTAPSSFPHSTPVPVQQSPNGTVLGMSIGATVLGGGCAKSLGLRRGRSIR